MDLFYSEHMRRNLKGQYVKGSNGNTYEGFGVWYDRKGYPTIWIGGKSVKVHVYAWERINGAKPAGCVLHHKDYNKANYFLDNLELMSESDHRRLHAGWVRKNGEWVAKPCNRCLLVLPLSGFYPRKGYTPSALCKSCHNAEIKKRNSDPERKEKLKQYKHDYHLRKKEAHNA